MLSVAFLYACGEDEKDDAPQQTVAKEKPEDSEQDSTIDMAQLESARKDYEENYLGSIVAKDELGWTGTKVNCWSGDISRIAKKKILQRINYFRRQAGLHDQIVFDSILNWYSQDAALMMKVNNDLDHFPPDWWQCFTQKGAEAARFGNLAQGSFASEHIDSWIEDAGSNNISVGHRRWILNTVGKTFGIGSTDVTGVLYCIGNFDNNPPVAPDFVAWPPAGFVAEPLLFPRWSFGIKDANFGQAEVLVKDATGAELEERIIYRNGEYAEPAIVWELASRTAPKGGEPAVYDVEISNVWIDGEFQDFSYQVISFNP